MEATDINRTGPYDKRHTPRRRQGVKAGSGMGWDEAAEEMGKAGCGVGHLLWRVSSPYGFGAAASSARVPGGWCVELKRVTTKSGVGDLSQVIRDS